MFRSGIIDLFIAASPFQLLCILEAARYSKDKVPKVLIIVKNAYYSSFVESLNKLLSVYDWHKIIFAENDGKFKFLREIIFCHSLGKYQIRDFYFSDYQGLHLQAILAFNLKIKGKLFLVDDGAATVIMQKKYISKNKPHFNINKPYKNSFKKFLMILTGLKVSYNKKVNLFTIFNLQPQLGQVVLRNELSFLKALIPAESVNEQSIFLGANLVELKCLDLSTYIGFVEYAVKKINKPIMYYPHRAESEATLNEIRKIKNLNICSNKYFIELELVKNKVFPLNIISFWSTSIYTLHILFPKSNLFLINVDYREFKLPYYDEIEMIYNFYRSQLPINFLN